MNYGRLVLAAVVATIADAAYGFIIYGFVMKGQFAVNPLIFRPFDLQAPYMPVLFGGILIAMLAATWIYSKGDEGGADVLQDARVGAAVGVFVVGYVWTVNYAIMDFGGRIVAGMALPGFVEWIIAGIVIGVIYKPRIAVNAKTANV